MKKVYNETDITWSSIEKDFMYDKVNWSIRSNGIPVYTLYDERGNKIEVNYEV